MKLKVFCSLPMKDVPWPEIENNLLCMKGQFTAARVSKYGFSPDDEFEFIDNLYCGGTPMKGILHEPVWYLHKALEKLADCDMALFHSDWEKANGCVIEHAVCTRYNIPIYYCDSVKDTNTVEAWGATWTWSGEERPKYTKYVKMDPKSRYTKAMKNAFEEAEWFFTDMMSTYYRRGKELEIVEADGPESWTMDEKQIANCQDMINAIVNAAVLKYKWERSVLEGENGET